MISLNRLPSIVLALGLVALAPAVASAQPTDGIAAPSGTNPWHDVDPRYDARDVSVRAFIEISKGSKNKNEIDKATGKIKLDRVIQYHEGYPANYGFIPRSFAGDGDPLDVLVLGDRVREPGEMVDVRVIGVIRMEDQGEADDKLIAVDKGDPKFAGIRDVKELPPEQVEHLSKFFREYKVAEKKIVRVRAAEGRVSARAIVAEAFKDYDKKFTKPVVEPKRGLFSGFGDFLSKVGRGIASVFSRDNTTEKARSRGMSDLLEERLREGRERTKDRVR